MKARQPKEATITRSILLALKELPHVYAVKLHGNPYQSQGLPDILAINLGAPVFLEVKRPGEHMTPLQRATAMKIEAAGAPVWVVVSKTEALLAVSRQGKGQPTDAQEQYKRRGGK